MQVDTALVRELATLLDETQLTEIEVVDGERKIRVARQGAPMAAPAPVSAPVAIAPSVSAPAAPAAPAGPHPGTVKSPMVGTVYLASSPESAPFVSEGATVKEGDTLVIIEAMKVMNPITAPRAGRVTQINVSNGQPVEFDQPLVVIE
jgi:acetyl-CoA carboxylase biotin carboxyl carrier protein